MHKNSGYVDSVLWPDIEIKLFQFIPHVAYIQSTESSFDTRINAIPSEITYKIRQNHRDQ